MSQYFEERSLIFFLCDHHTETIELLYILFYLNITPVLIPEDIDRELFENLLDIYQPQYIYCNKERKIREEYAHKVELEHHTILNTNTNRYLLHPDIAVLLSTSGTTGSPKLIKLSYDNLYYNAQEVSIDEKTHELLLKGNCIFLGYANDVKQLAECDANTNVLHTGDKAYIDEEGYVYLKGRLTRYVKILGKRVSLDDIERYLGNKFPGTEFACTGIDDDVNIYYTDIEHNPAKGIKNMLDRNLKIPKKFVSCFPIEKIPRNSSGKIMELICSLEEEYHIKFIPEEITNPDNFACVNSIVAIVNTKILREKEKTE